MTQCLPLNEVFADNNDFAWRILEAECKVHMNENVRLIHITTLTQLYMKGVERLNSIRDDRERFFADKMTKLMAEPIVIKILNNESASKKGQMENKKIQLEQKLSQQAEKNLPQRLQTLIHQQNQKEQRLQHRINAIIEEHERTLQKRLQARNLNKPKSSGHKKEEECQTEDRQIEKQEWGTPIIENKEQNFRKILSEKYQIDFS